MRWSYWLDSSRAEVRCTPSCRIPRMDHDLAGWLWPLSSWIRQPCPSRPRSSGPALQRNIFRQLAEKGGSEFIAVHSTQRFQRHLLLELRREATPPRRHSPAGKTPLLTEHGHRRYATRQQQFARNSPTLPKALPALSPLPTPMVRSAHGWGSTGKERRYSMATFVRELALNSPPNASHFAETNHASKERALHGWRWCRDR